MKLTLDGIKDRQAWEKAGIKLPGYDVEAVSKKAKDAPGWVHFGIGNIFRVFIGGIAGAGRGKYQPRYADPLYPAYHRGACARHGTRPRPSHRI